jgi:hypothetical protein
MTTTSHLALTLIDSAQAQKEITANAAFARLDAVLNTGAKDKDLATSPASPAAGDVYIVAASPTGAWAGQAGMIAYFDQVWNFITPNEGMTLWVSDEDTLYSFDGANWVRSGGVRALSVQSGGDANSSASGSGTDYDHSLTYAIPANFLNANKALRVTAHFRLTTGSSVPTLAAKLKLGSVALADQTPVGFPASLTNNQYALSWLVQATGAPGPSASLECAPLTGPAPVASGAYSIVAMPVSVATDAAQTLKIGTQWGSAGSGTNSVTLSQLIVEALN